MTDRIHLGRSDLQVPRLGLGAMTWGSPAGRSRWGPAKLAYGGTPGPEEEARAFEASLSAGVDLFDSAAMYSGGASERRLGELAEGRGVVIATKFPPGWRSKADAFPEALDQSLGRLRRSHIDLYQHHFPSRRISIPSLMGLMADAVEAGKVRAVGVSNYSAQQLRSAHAALAERGIPLASNQVEYSLLPGRDRLFVRHRRFLGGRAWCWDEQDDYGDQTKHAPYPTWVVHHTVTYCETR